MNAVTWSSTPYSPRLHICDKMTGLEFLIDSGSDVSIAPKQFVKKPRIRINYSLFTANKSKITTTDIQDITLDFELSKKYMWNFIVADIPYSIIRADFLGKNNLLVDLTRRRLIEEDTCCSALCYQRDTSHFSVQLVLIEQRIDSRVQELLKQFESITKPPQYMENPLHDVVHHIYTKGNPVAVKPRRLHLDIFNQVRLEFQEMVKTGGCRRSSSQ